MIIEQPPWLYRIFFRKTWWRLPKPQKCVYLTFDDGPIPEVTPWVLSTLAHYGVKATFFCVGDNVRKYPELFERLLAEGHQVGNHTFNHLVGIKSRSARYIFNIEKADRLINSLLFRPPHGHIRPSQGMFAIQKYQLVMWDVVTRDYNPKFTADDVFRIVQKYTRNGSIIVFHDSLKSIDRLHEALPRTIEWLRQEGYTIEQLPCPPQEKY